MPEASGRPWFTLTGTTAVAVADRGITTLHLSMSHDAGFATAYVIAEASDSPSSSAVPSSPEQHIRDEATSGARRLGADTSSRGGTGAGEEKR